MSPIRRLIAYLLRYRPPLLTGALCVVGSAVFSLSKPLIIGRAVNDLVRQPSSSVLLLYGGLLIAAAAIEGVFHYLQRWIIIGVSRKIEYDLRADFYGHLQSLPLSFYQGQRTGDLMSRATSDISNVRMLIGPAVMHAFSSVLIVAGAFVMMLRIDLGLALLSLISVPVVAGIVKAFGEKIHERFKSVQDYFGDISARVQENLSGVRVIRAFGQEENEIALFKRMNREYVDRNRSLIRLTSTFHPLLHGIIGLMFILVFFIGSRKILAGSMLIGSFVAFQFYLGRMIWPLIAFGWVINLFQRGTASMKRLSEIWDVSPEEDQNRADAAPTASEGEIILRDLTFSYGAGNVLENLNLQVKPGQTVGITGRTGSGKSTLLALLAKMHEPPPGTVFVDGQAIDSLPASRIRSMVGMVPQETFLFSETIAENIRFGRAEATDEEVERVADLAGLSADLLSFPQGLQTMVGERGITLSGGQKQRTAIARAIIRDPAILLLDDSLSAVDTETEERILRTLKEIRRGRTVLVVSHRVSSVKDADQIVVLEQGRIVERGTHEELVELGGYYADLYRRQTLEAEIEEIA